MRRRSEPDSQRYHQHKRSISAERSKIGEDEPVDGFGEAYERQNEDEEKIEEREFNSSDENENSNNNNNNNSNNNNNNNNINNNNNNSSSHGEDDSNQREEANESRDNGRNHSPDNSNDFDSGNSSNKNNASFSGKSAPSRDSRQTMSSPTNSSNNHNSDSISASVEERGKPSHRVSKLLVDLNNSAFKHPFLLSNVESCETFGDLHNQVVQKFPKYIKSKNFIFFDVKGECYMADEQDVSSANLEEKHMLRLEYVNL